MTDIAFDSQEITDTTFHSPTTISEETSDYQNDAKYSKSVDLSLYQRPRVDIDVLPQEILEGIFQWLDIRSLDAAGLVCRKWNECISNDSVWRAAFVRYYGTGSFGRVSNSLSWKVEMIERYNCLRQWKKASGATHVTFKTPLPTISDFNMDFPAMRMVAFNSLSAYGAIADPSKGKVATPLLKTNGMSHHDEIMTSIAVSKFGLIYGFLNGLVAGVFFSKGTTVRTTVHFDDSHLSEVNSSWLAQDANPRSCEIGVITGDIDGTIIVWDATNGSKILDFKVGLEESSENIVYLDSDAKDKIIIGTSKGLVYLWEMSTRNLVNIGGPIYEEDFDLNLTEHTFLFETDFSGGYVVVSNGVRLLRHRIASISDQQETVMFSSHLPGLYFPDELFALAIDKSPHLNSNMSTSPKLIPGGNARHIIATDRGKNAYVWDLRAQVDVHGQIPLFHHISTPFHNPVNIGMVAINSLVFALASYQGMVVVYNLLTAKKLQLVTARFPRKIYDYSEGLPTALPYHHEPFHLKLDPDVTNPHGVIIIKGAVQYFNYGVDSSKSKVKAKGIKKRVPVKRSLHHGGPGTPRNEELLKEIDDDYLIMKEVNRDLASERRFHTPYITDGLTEEEELSYALMLSQDTPQDKDVEEAIKLSLEQEQLERENEAAHVAGSSKVAVQPKDMSDEDWEFEQALKLSMEEGGQDTMNPQQLSAEEYDEDLELALRLSMME